MIKKIIIRQQKFKVSFFYLELIKINKELLENVE